MEQSSFGLKAKFLTIAILFTCNVFFSLLLTFAGLGGVAYILQILINAGIATLAFLLMSDLPKYNMPTQPIMFFGIGAAAAALSNILLMVLMPSSASSVSEAASAIKTATIISSIFSIGAYVFYMLGSGSLASFIKGMGMVRTGCIVILAGLAVIFLGGLLVSEASSVNGAASGGIVAILGGLACFVGYIFFLIGVWQTYGSAAKIEAGK